MTNENRDPFSEFSQPMQPSGPPTSGRSWVLITAMICGTTLLLCGGVIGLGFYAVDRLADPLTGILSENDEPDEDTLAALEYMLADDPTIQELAGKIQEIREDDLLTYDFDADENDYFYTVIGEKAEVTVVCQLSDKEQVWFDSVEMLDVSSSPDGPKVGSPRKPVVTRHAPFDTVWSMRVWEVLETNESCLTKLNVGEVRWIEYDYREFDDAAGVAVPRLEFEITGTSGTTTIVGDFTTFEYEILKAISETNSDGSLGESIWAVE